MGMREENSFHWEFWIRSQVDVCRSKVRPVDIEPRDQVEVNEVMDPPRVPVLEELLVIDSIFSEVPAEIKKDPSSLLLDIDLVPPDTVCPVIRQ